MKVKEKAAFFFNLWLHVNAANEGMQAVYEKCRAATKSTRGTKGTKGFLCFFVPFAAALRVGSVRVTFAVSGSDACRRRGG